MTATALEQLEKKRAKLRQPLDELEQIEAQIEVERERLAEVERQAKEERRAAARRENAIQAAWDAYESDPDEAWLLRVEEARQRLTGYGQPDPGDRVINVTELAAPILERNRRIADNWQRMLMHDRATDEQCEASNRRHALAQQLHAEGHDWSEAQRLAALVVDDGVPLDEALGADEEEELYDDEATTADE